MRRKLDVRDKALSDLNTLEGWMPNNGDSIGGFGESINTNMNAIGVTNPEWILTQPLRYDYLAAMRDLLNMRCTGDATSSNCTAVNSISLGCDPESPENNEFGSCCMPDDGYSKVFVRCCDDPAPYCAACPSGRSNSPGNRKTLKSCTCNNGNTFGPLADCNGDVRFAPPSTSPTSKPSVAPTSFPTSKPTTDAPTFGATPFPTFTSYPTASPTNSPTTSLPTTSPTDSPTAAPSPQPTASPTTSQPTFAPTPPTASPTVSPTAYPSAQPSLQPTFNPSQQPTPAPTRSPTAERLDNEAFIPASDDDCTYDAAKAGCKYPLYCEFSGAFISDASCTLKETQGGDIERDDTQFGGGGVTSTSPTASPTFPEEINDIVIIEPTPRPTESPTSAAPTIEPTPEPTHTPTTHPTSAPTTTSPTVMPSAAPTIPTAKPSASPTQEGDTNTPTISPTSAMPTESPTPHPTPVPSQSPTTGNPTVAPSPPPTTNPTTTPTSMPTTKDIFVIQVIQSRKCGHRLLVQETNGMRSAEAAFDEFDLDQNNLWSDYEFAHGLNISTSFANQVYRSISEPQEKERARIQWLIDFREMAMSTATGELGRDEYVDMPSWFRSYGSVVRGFVVGLAGSRVRQTAMDFFNLNDKDCDDELSEAEVRSIVDDYNALVAAASPTVGRRSLQEGIASLKAPALVTPESYMAECLRNSDNGKCNPMAYNASVAVVVAEDEQIKAAAKANEVKTLFCPASAGCGQPRLHLCNGTGSNCAAVCASDGTGVEAQTSAAYDFFDLDNNGVWNDAEESDFFALFSQVEPVSYKSLLRKEIDSPLVGTQLTKEEYVVPLTVKVSYQNQMDNGFVVGLIGGSAVRFFNFYDTNCNGRLDEEEVNLISKDYEKVVNKPLNPKKFLKACGGTCDQKSFIKAGEQNDDEGKIAGAIVTILIICGVLGATFLWCAFYTTYKRCPNRLPTFVRKRFDRIYFHPVTRKASTAMHSTLNLFGVDSGGYFSGDTTGSTKQLRKPPNRSATVDSGESDVGDDSEVQTLEQGKAGAKDSADPANVELTVQ